jgi:hypothetical protein
MVQEKIACGRRIGRELARRIEEVGGRCSRSWDFQQGWCDSTFVMGGVSLAYRDELNEQWSEEAVAAVIP